MSVLVKDMKMPKRCLDCPMYDCYNYNCQMYAFGIPARYNRDGSTRPEWCELVELPEKHGRLVDADKIIKAMNEMKVEGEVFVTAVEYVKLIVGDASTVIEAEGKS